MVNATGAFAQGDIGGRGVVRLVHGPLPPPERRRRPLGMNLPVMPPVQPMLAKATPGLPKAEGLVFEPKWDGFRCIVFHDGDEVELGSRNERPLTRYFPELVESLQQMLPDKCVLDGEIVIAGPNGLDFDALQLRLHPAASRVRKL